MAKRKLKKKNEANGEGRSSNLNQMCCRRGKKQKKNSGILQRILLGETRGSSALEMLAPKLAKGWDGSDTLRAIDGREVGCKGTDI